MDQSPSWKADSLIAHEVFPRLICIPQIRHRVHNRTPPFVHWAGLLQCITSLHFFKIRFNVNLPYMPRYSLWSISLAFYFPTPATRTAHLCLLVLCTLITLGEKCIIMNIFIIQLCLALRCFLPISPVACAVPNNPSVPGAECSLSKYFRCVCCWVLQSHVRRATLSTDCPVLRFRCVAHISRSSPPSAA